MFPDPIMMKWLRHPINELHQEASLTEMNVGIVVLVLIGTVLDEAVQSFKVRRFLILILSVFGLDDLN